MTDDRIYTKGLLSHGDSLPRPIFSILITSYNRPETIAGCIDSVLANEGEDYEIIISDDASPTADAIEAVIRPYLAHTNIQFHRLQTNFGEPANRNYLVSQATGDYNIILCDDDKMFPHALRTIRRSIECHPGHDIYGFGYMVIDEKGKPCYSRYAPNGIEINLEHPELVRRMLEGTWLPFLICHPSTFCCKRGVEREIPYRQDVSMADDYMFLLECLNKGKRMYVMSECLVSYQWLRSHKTTRQLNQSSDIFRVLQAYVMVYYALQQKTDLHPSVLAFIHSYDYRKRFLYELIVRRTQVAENRIELLKLHPAHQQELSRYMAKPWRYVVLLKIYFTVVYEFAQQFGLKGIIYSIQTGIAYLRYKVLRI